MSEYGPGYYLIRCRKCGHMRGFRSNRPMTAYRCACGAWTQLEELVPMQATCPCCETGMHYRTNLKTDHETLMCRNCGAPVDVIRTGKGYVND